MEQSIRAHISNLDDELERMRKKRKEENESAVHVAGSHVQQNHTRRNEDILAGQNSKVENAETIQIQVFSQSS